MLSEARLVLDERKAMPFVPDLHQAPSDNHSSHRTTTPAQFFSSLVTDSGGRTTARAPNRRLCRGRYDCEQAGQLVGGGFRAPGHVRVGGLGPIGAGFFPEPRRQTFGDEDYGMLLRRQKTTAGCPLHASFRSSASVIESK